ncbi:MAG: hypothetical protein ACRYFS_09245 [Janthinobacterium lividum]
MISRPAEAILVICLMACLGALGLHAATQVTSFDPVAATVGNARLLTLALTQYAEDSNEQLPPMQNAAVFETALRPYVPDPAVFVSQITGRPFIPNPMISGKGLYALGDLSIVTAFRDVLPPSNIPATVGFLDGHIERGGVVIDNTQTGSYQNARVLAVGVIEYTQDNDEVFPPTATQPQFEAALLPYVHQSRYFVDPNNGKPFVPNPALSEISIANIFDPASTVLLQSAMPYKNGIPTIAYADGHVTPVPAILAVSPGSQDASNLKQIGLATFQYAVDYNETLPETTNYTQFEDILLPYIRNSSLFVSPGTGLPYVLNPAIGGMSLASIASPSDTEEMRDAQINPDGTFNILELDGHVKQDAYFVTKAVVVTPDNRTHLFWPKGTQEAALWTLTPTDTVKNTDTLTSSSSAIAFGVGTDSQSHVLWGNNYPGSVFDVPITGAITVDTIAADGTQESSTQFGPYDGWTALFLATGADNSSRLLWQHYDGALALWTLSPDGDFLGSVSLPALTSTTVLVGLALGADGLTRLLVNTSAGKGHLWTLSESGQLVRSTALPSFSNSTLTALAVGVDGSSRLLWSSGLDKAIVLTMAVNGQFTGYTTFGLTGGGTASQIAVGSDQNLRVLWAASNGSRQLQTLTATGKQQSLLSLTPYQ